MSRLRKYTIASRISGLLKVGLTRIRICCVSDLFSLFNHCVINNPLSYVLRMAIAGLWALPEAFHSYHHTLHCPPIPSLKPLLYSHESPPAACHLINEINPGSFLSTGYIIIRRLDKYVPLPNGDQLQLISQACSCCTSCGILLYIISFS